MNLLARLIVPPTGPPPGPVDPGRGNCFDYTTGDVAEVVGMDKLASAINTAPPTGRQVLLAPGTYAGGTMTFNRSGPNPVVVRPLGGLDTVKITDARWALAAGSRGIVLTGLSFEGARITTNGLNHRVSRCMFRKINGNTIYISVAKRTRVDHCDFAGYVAGTGARGCVILGEEAVGRGQCLDVLVDHNHFHDIDPASGGNGQELLGLHSSSNGADSAYPGLVVHRNLFERIRLPGEGELVGMKTSGIVLRFNTVLNTRSPAYINAPRRACKVELRSNWFESTPSNIVMVRSDDALVIGNLFEGGLNCYICPGDAYWNPDAANGLYFASRRARIVGNRMGTGRIIVGQDPFDHTGRPVVGANLWGNARAAGGSAHSLITGKHTGTTFEHDAEPHEPAKKLSPSDVGLRAVDPFCPG